MTAKQRIQERIVEGLDFETFKRTLFTLKQLPVRLERSGESVIRLKGATNMGHPSHWQITGHIIKPEGGSMHFHGEIHGEKNVCFIRYDDPG